MLSACGSVPFPKYGSVSFPKYGSVSFPKYGSVSFPKYGSASFPKYGSVSFPKYGSVSFPRFAGEGRDGGQRVPYQSSEYLTKAAHISVSSVRSRLSPTSVLLSARSFVPHLGPLECEVVCPPPRSSPIHGGGRCCHMRVVKLHVATSPYSNAAASPYSNMAASPSPASRGKAGMGDSEL